MGKALGTVLGGAAGFMIGGPAGAFQGAKLGAGVDIARATIGAGEEQAAAAQQAANTYGASADRASDVQRQMFERQVELQEPFRQGGIQALNQLIPMATNYKPFGMQQFQQDPGYAFRLSEGMKALDQQAAARGGLMSGNALRAAQQYGQGLASQEYQNAFNRYQTEREAQLNPLQSLANLSQTGTQSLGSAGQQYATNVGNIGIGAGAAQGNALMAGAQARGSAYQGIAQQFGNFMGQPSMQNALRGFGGPVDSQGYGQFGSFNPTF